MTDRTPYSNDGQNYGVTLGSGSTSFDGSNDYIQMPNRTLWASGTDAFTFSFWINPNSLNDNWRTVIENRPGNVNTGIWIGVHDKKLEIYTSSAVIIGDNVLSDDTWYYVTVVGNGGDDGSRNVKVYLNTVQEGSTWTNNYDFTSNLLRIGAHNILNSYNFPGNITGVKIYNRALSAAEIKLLYDKGR